MSLIKSAADQQRMRKAGHLLAAVLDAAVETAVPGVVLRELDLFIAKCINEGGAKPSFLGHEGYPASSCLSVNDAVVHGIPDGYVLKEGDILGIDAGLWLDGVCSDSAITVAIGNPAALSEDQQKLLTTTFSALKKGVAQVKPFRRVGVISSTVQAVAESEDLGIVRGLTGHGVGHAVWEDPEVPNHGLPGSGAILRPGMCIAIEPMFTLGSGTTVTDIDGWTVRSAEGLAAAQYEYTVLITERGVENLTPWKVPAYLQPN